VRFSSIVVPGLVGQTLDSATIVPRIVTRKLRVFIPPGSRQRIVYVVQERKIAVTDAPRVVAVIEGQRTVAITGSAARTVTIDPSSRRVVITADRGEEL
jgi:hypothetical protein